MSSSSDKTHKKGVVKPALKKTCENSTLFALPRIMKATNSFQKYIWIAVLVVGLGGAGCQLVRLFIGYFEYETGVNIEEVLGATPFPDVTVCHLDPTWTIRMLEQEVGDDDVNYDRYLDRISKLQGPYNSNDTEYKQLDKVKNFRGYLQNVPRVKEEKDHLAKLFILDCRVLSKWGANMSCLHNQSNPNLTAEVFIDPLYGVCVTFKTRMEKMDELNLIVYMDDQAMKPSQHVDDWLIGMMSPIGTKVVVHPQDTYPDLMYLFKRVSAGVLMEFQVKGSKRSILPKPYSNCITEAMSQQYMERGVFGNKLKRHGFECYRLQARDYIRYKCGCHHLFYASHEFDIRNQTVNYCGMLGDNDNISSVVSNMNCADEAMKELSEKVTLIDSEDCPTPCDQYTYDFTTDSVEWPYEYYQLKFYEQHIRHSPLRKRFQMYEDLVEWNKKNKTKEVTKALFRLTDIKRNFARIKILHQQFKYLQYKDNPLVSTESLFGNIGGILSLWVGITFITIIEIVEFVYQLKVEKKARPTSSGNNNLLLH